MKHEIEIPDEYEVQGYDMNKDNTMMCIVLKKKQTKDFSFYVDQYLYENGSTNDQIVNWLSEDIISVAKHRLKTGLFHLVPWEIKIGLFRFICNENKLNWVEEMEESRFDNIAHSIKYAIPQEFIYDLFKTKTN